MKHYIFLGINLTGSSSEKVAFHIPLKDVNSVSMFENVNGRLNKEVSNKNAFSIYLVESSRDDWNSVISENKYFSSIEKPMESIDDFIKILNNIKIRSIDVASYILRIEKCTSLRLQKILYLVYATYLKKYNQKLFDEKFYAWEYGPVNIEVYKHYDSKAHNLKTIKLSDSHNQLDNKNTIKKTCINDELYKRVTLSKDFENIYSVISDVITKYKDYKTFELVNLVHSNDSAWIKTEKNKAISDNDIENSKF